MVALLQSRFKKKYLLYFPAFYFMVLGTINLIGDVLWQAFYWFDFFIFILFAIPLFVKKATIYQVLGWFYALIWGYLLLALWSDYIHYERGRDHYTQPGLYFGGGSLFISFSLLCAVLLIYIGAKKLKPAVK